MPTRARIATTTKIISHGEVMTSSTQLVSNVPCGEKSSAGVVYVAVAAARPGATALTVAFTFGGRSERYETTYSFESCCPIVVKIGSSCSGVALSTYVPPVCFAALSQRLGVVLGRLQADRDDAYVRRVECSDRLLACRLDATQMSVREEHGSRTLVARLFGQTRRLDQGVVDACAFGRGRSLRDRRRELSTVSRELGEDRDLGVVGDDRDGKLILALRHERASGSHGRLDRLAGHAVRRVDEKDRAAGLRPAVDRQPRDEPAILGDVQAFQLRGGRRPIEPDAIRELGVLRLRQRGGAASLTGGEGRKRERGQSRARDRDPQAELHAVAPRRSSRE